MSTSETPRQLGDEQRYRALFDPETELPTWVLLRDRLEVALGRARRTNSQVLVVWFELHSSLAERPTTVIRTLTHAMQSALRPDDTLARVDDYEIVALCNDILHEDAHQFIVDRLFDAIPKLDVVHAQAVTRVGTTLARPTESAQQVLETARGSLRPVAATTFPLRAV
jgi:GGDEF domain-containing protein